jgi:hypothetical protein
MEQDRDRALPGRDDFRATGSVASDTYGHRESSLSRVGPRKARYEKTQARRRDIIVSGRSHRGQLSGQFIRPGKSDPGGIV